MPNSHDITLIFTNAHWCRTKRCSKRKRLLGQGAVRTVLIFNARTKIWSPKNVQTGQKGPRARAGYQCGSGQPHEPAARARRDILPNSKHAAQRAPKAIFLSHHSTTALQTLSTHPGIARTHNRPPLKLQRKRVARWTSRVPGKRGANGQSLAPLGRILGCRGD